MSEYIYSAKNNAFYPVNMKEDYVEAGSWPDDGKDVSEDCFLEFTSVSHTDKYRVAGEDGLPAWEQVPAPTNEQLIAIADAEKMRLIGLANIHINAKQWPGKAAIGRLKGDELAKYNLWLDYLTRLRLLIPPTAWALTGLSPRKISDIHQMDAIIYNAGISILFNTSRSLTDKSGSHMRSNFN
jgi:hypothetical protein